MLLTVLLHFQSYHDSKFIDIFLCHFLFSITPRNNVLFWTQIGNRHPYSQLRSNLGLMKTIIHYGMNLFYIIRETVAILPNPD